MIIEQELIKFVHNVLEDDIDKRDVYGYVAKYSEEYPFWNLFLVYDGSKNEKYCGGYCRLSNKNLNDEDLSIISSIFKNLSKKVIVNNDEYFFKEN